MPLTDNQSDHYFARTTANCQIIDSAWLIDYIFAFSYINKDVSVLVIDVKSFGADLFSPKEPRAEAGFWLQMGWSQNGYVLATVHRAENADDLLRLRAIVGGLDSATEQIPVLLPLAPPNKSLDEAGKHPAAKD